MICKFILHARVHHEGWEDKLVLLSHQWCIKLFMIYSLFWLCQLVIWERVFTYSTMSLVDYSLQPLSRYIYVPDTLVTSLHPYIVPWQGSVGPLGLGWRVGFPFLGQLPFLGKYNGIRDRIGKVSSPSLPCLMVLLSKVCLTYS